MSRIENKVAFITGGASGIGAGCARRFEIEGKNLGYPTDFRDGSAALGLFVVPGSEANALIAHSGFEVAKIAPGSDIYSCLFHYRYH